MKPSKKGGVYYGNEVWFSPAYQRLTPKARDLLHCLMSELRYGWKKVGNKKGKVFHNNGQVSCTEVEFRKLVGCVSRTYIESRNLLIKVGFIKQTYRGGMGPGDCATYKILAMTNLPTNQERWRDYPEKNWSNDIPRPKEQLVGVETQWQKGECGRKS